MLQSLAELGEQYMLRFLFRNVAAYDLETEAELHYSEGRRPYGRPTRYYVSAPNGRQIIHYFRTEVTLDNPKGASITRDMGRVFGITAFTDKQAIEKANSLFPKKYARFLQEQYHVSTWEQGKDFGRAWWQAEGSP